VTLPEIREASVKRLPSSGTLELCDFRSSAERSAPAVLVVERVSSSAW